MIFQSPIQEFQPQLPRQHQHLHQRHEEEGEKFDLHFDEELTLELVLSVPEKEYTGLITGIVDSEDYLVDVSYSEWFQTS